MAASPLPSRGPKRGVLETTGLPPFCEWWGFRPFGNAGTFAAPLGTPGPTPIWERRGFRSLGRLGLPPLRDRRGLRPFGTAGASATLGTPGLPALTQRHGSRPFGITGGTAHLGTLGLPPIWERWGFRPFVNVGAPPPLGRPWVPSIWDHWGLRSFRNAGASAPFRRPGLPPLCECWGLWSFMNAGASALLATVGLPPLWECRGPPPLERLGLQLISEGRGLGHFGKPRACAPFRIASDFIIVLILFYFIYRDIYRDHVLGVLEGFRKMGFSKVLHLPLLPTCPPHSRTRQPEPSCQGPSHLRYHNPTS